MSKDKDIELDDALGEAQSLITAIFLAAGAIDDRQAGNALQVVASAAQDNIRHARCLIDDIREEHLVTAPAHAVGNDAEILQLGSDIMALCARFDQIKAKVGGQAN